MRYPILLSAVLLAGLPGCQSNQPKLSTGLVGHWAFDESSGGQVTDSSPLRRHGTNTGASYVQGVSGKALFFDTGNHSVEIARSPGVNFEKAMTMAAWIFPSEEYYTVGCIVGPNGCMSVMKLRSMYLASCYNPSLEHAMLDSAARIPKNEWVHVAITYDGRRLATFINGRESSHRDADVDLRVANAGFLIGRNTDRERPDYFRGSMDEVRVYTRALGADEIQALSNRPSANQ